MFYPLGKNSEKPYGGVASTPPPSPLVRPRVNQYMFLLTFLANIKETKRQNTTRIPYLMTFPISSITKIDFTSQARGTQ